MPAPSWSPYDRLARHYRSLSDRRATYLAAVEAMVLSAAPQGCRRYLDVGAGDGLRTRRLATALDVADLVLAEPSSGMAALAQAGNVAGETLWQLPMEELPQEGLPFDLITCLWNVLGHVPGPRSRIAGLERVRGLLAPGGRLVIDVNNRHNALAYGRWRVFWRRVVDALAPDDRRGDVTVSWQADGELIEGKGHLFTPAEMRNLFQIAGLRVVTEQTIDYVTGAPSRRLTDGQLIYVLERAHA